MKMLNSDHEPHITGTPMPHGKPQIHIGCGGNMRDQGDTTRNQFILSVYVKSALLDSIYESIPKVFAGQPFFITYSALSLNPARLEQQPHFRSAASFYLSLPPQIEPSLGNHARHLRSLTPARTGQEMPQLSIIAGNALWASDTASHPARYRLGVRPCPSAIGNGPFPSASELGQWLHPTGKNRRT